MNKAYFERLFLYTAWADQRSLNALRAIPTAHAEALPLLAHLLAAEHVWLQRLLHREPRHAVWPTLDIDQCTVLAAENEAGYKEFLSQIEDQQLTDLVVYRSTQGIEFTSSVLDILTQVALHGPYHRGQIAKVIGRNGEPAINTDFITFTRETKP